MFTENFNGYVCDGESIQCEVDGFTCFAKLHDDDLREPPWQRCDGHGTVSEWTTRDKRPGELLLHRDGGNRRYYDYAESCRTARADGWGMKGGMEPGETKRAYAARAAMNDFEMLRAWCCDHWHYFGVEVDVWKAEVKLTGNFSHTLWGIEGNYPGGDNSYFTAVANDLLQNALDAAKNKILELVQD